MADRIQQGLHGCTPEELYTSPTDPLILQRLEWFRDQKLDLMKHYGPYSQLGIDASWSLSDEDASWSRADVDWETDGDSYRRQYTALAKTFNPVRFQPEKWAQFAAENGFKYLIFTTKHHDGFCMFDTKYTDYRIPGPGCPFRSHKDAIITREVFEAFREKGIAIAAYFSKPDWNCPWYWAEGMERPAGHDRNPTYDIEQHPALWEKFAQFTRDQILELMRDYGRIDILWLDGGQVCAQNGQDIHMSDIIAEARKMQPWLITADRTAGGENENYITPELSIPDHAVRIPWESCVTVGTQWGYKFEDTYKTARELIHMLVQVVSRGGNLALNIGPQPNGELPTAALRELEGLGAWLRINGEAIYATRPADTVQIGDIYYTKKEDALYAIRLLDADEVQKSTLCIPADRPVSTVTCLSTGETLAFEQHADVLHITLSGTLSGKEHPAVAFRLV